VDNYTGYNGANGLGPEDPRQSMDPVVNAPEMDALHLMRDGVLPNPNATAAATAAQVRIFPSAFVSILTLS